MGYAVSAISLALRTEGVERAIKQLKTRALPAIARALNRSIASGKTEMVRAIADDMRLKQSDLRDKLLITPATPQRLVATLAASKKRIPLMLFGARGPVPSRGKGRGVTARTATGRYPTAFIATMPTGHVGVFQRKNKGRLPIKELFGASIGHVFEKYRPQGLARAEEQLVKNISHELRFALSQAA